MREATSVHRSARAAALLFLLACSDDYQAPDATPASAPDASSQAAGRGADAAVWLARQRVIDFTGDGVADTVRLRAVGPTADSLRITLTFWADGAERWREEWASEYELVDPPPLADAAARAEYVRRRLDRTVASVQIEPFDSSDYLTMADPVDSAVLRQPPSHQVSYAFGFETTVVLAWDPVDRKLWRLHACC